MSVGLLRAISFELSLLTRSTTTVLLLLSTLFGRSSLARCILVLRKLVVRSSTAIVNLGVDYEMRGSRRDIVLKILDGLGLFRLESLLLLNTLVHIFHHDVLLNDWTTILLRDWTTNHF